MPNFPRDIPIEDLRKTHAEYNPEKLNVYQALYDGGSAIDDVKEILLPQRAVEKMPDAEGVTGLAAYKERLARAPYTRRIAGFVDWMIAAMFLEAPRLEFEGLSESAEKYYLGLEQNCDGRKTSLAQLMRDAVLEGMIHRRSYLSVEFPKTTAKQTDIESLRGSMRLFRAREVEDWEYDSDGSLHWIRWHGAEFLRSPTAPWKVPEKIRHVWAFITSDSTELYQAQAKWPGDVYEKKEAQRYDTKTYAGGLPVFEIRYRAGQWIMETCYDIVRALFARDASIEHLGDKFAFQILVLTLNRASVKNVYLPDLGALLLQQGENANFVAPQAILDPLFKSAEKLRRDLMDSIQASAQNAASIPQAGRLSGDAVSKMREPLQVLLQSFARPVIEAFQSGIDRIITLRGDPKGSVRVIAPDQCHVSEAGLKEALNTSFEKQMRGVA